MGEVAGIFLGDLVVVCCTEEARRPGSKAVAVIGFAFRHCAVTIGVDEEVRIGVRVINDAYTNRVGSVVLESSVEYFAHTFDFVIMEVLKGKDDFGFNARTGEYTNMKKAGIIDPAKVTRIAVENAGSIAGMILTTEAVISEIKKDEPAPMMPPGGGMPGMM